MSGPRPHGHPSDHPPEAPYDHPEQPETAPPGVPASGFPEPPGKDPGDLSRRPTPYTSLNTPVGEPDPTEWPDPYDRREDPRAPAADVVCPGDGRSHTPPGAISTSEPHPDADVELGGGNAPEGDDLDQ